MKIAILFTTSLLNISMIYSQVPNAGFENWNGSIPFDWFSSGGSGYVFQDLNSHSGIYAARFQTASGTSGVTNSTFATRTVNNTSYFPVGSITAPSFVYFWAITNFMGDDVLNVNVTFKQGTTIVGVINQQCVMTNSATYQQYSFQILYNPPNAIPDSVAMWFTIHEGGCSTFSNLVRAGTFAIIDDISYSPLTGINSSSVQSLIDYVVTNATNGVIDISFVENIPASLEIKLLDVSGATVKQFVSPGSGSNSTSVQLDISEMSPGIYFLNIFDGHESSIKKVIRF